MEPPNTTTIPKEMDRKVAVISRIPHISSVLRYPHDRRPKVQSKRKQPKLCTSSAPTLPSLSQSFIERHDYIQVCNHYLQPITCNSEITGYSLKRYKIYICICVYNVCICNIVFAIIKIICFSNGSSRLVCVSSFVTVVFLMLKHNYCWDLMDSKMDRTSFIKSKSLGTTRNYLKVSNNRDCGKVHKQCQQECKLL